MKKLVHNHGRSGFTMLEAVTAITLMTVLLAAVVSGFAYVMRGDRLIRVQSELDMDARIMIERIRNDMWMTSRAEILMHPPGEGPCTAMSFPVLTGGHAADTNPDGSLIWDSTVIYHFYGEGDSFEVRRTVFNPRTQMTKDEYQEQLADVVEAGDGSTSVNGENSTTTTLIANLVDWQLNTTASRFDAWAAAAGSRVIALGTVQLQEGAQTISFEVVGKNKASRGSARYLGVDRLTLTPAGMPLEGEWMTVAESVGPTPVAQNIGSNEAWSGNARLWFPAIADGQSFSLSFTNDLWEEQNFFAGGDRKEHVERLMVTNNGINTFALRLIGNGETWSAETNSTLTEMTLTGDVDVAVPLNGTDGFIRFDGAMVKARFYAPNAQISNLRIYENGDSGSPVLFGAGTLNVTGSTVSTFANYTIRTTNNYYVAFTVASGSVVRVGSAGSLKDILRSVDVGYSPEGIYTSGIVDTRLSNPTYRSCDWAATLPSGSGSGASLVVKVRAGNQMDLSDAPDWSSVSAAVNGFTPSISGRYIQMQAFMTPSVNATTGETFSPELRDFELSWAGEPRFVSMGGTFSVGPDHGIYEVKVNGAPLLRGVTIDLTVYQALPMAGGRIVTNTARAFTEIVPRN